MGKISLYSMRSANLVQDIQGKQIRPTHVVQWLDESSVAVLIDGENAPPKLIEFIQSRAERLGALIPQHVHGDWSSGCNGWERVLVPYRLEARHHGQVAAGKNATDIALVVDAMQLYNMGIRKFCIVASDSDYTPLVEFLCAQGCLVIVMGMPTTPPALQGACSAFVQLPISHVQAVAHGSFRFGKEVPLSHVGTASIQKHDSLGGGALPSKMSREQLKIWILEGLSSYEPSSHAWVQVPRFREYLVRRDPSFKPKAYGYKNILVLLQAFPELFELRPHQGQAFVHEVRRVKTEISH